MAASAAPITPRITIDNPVVARWLVAFAVMASAMMELVDTSAVNVSLPYIAGNLSATVTEATWVLTSYLVSNAIVLPLAGWLANYFGRKRLLMMAVICFTISSVLCGLAPNLPLLVFFRVLQGASGGSLQPTSRAILLEAFPREERAHAMAFWGVGIVVAPIVAPVLGGWLTTDYSWRWVFFLNVPVSILALVLVEMFIFDPPYIRRRSNRIDYWGMGMLATGIAAFQVMLDKGQEDDWFSSHFIVILAVIAAVCMVTFVFWELRVEDPVVHFHLFRYRTFTSGTCLSAVLGVVLYGSIVLIPLFMQTLLGFPALTAGIWSSPRGMITLVLMPVAAFLIGRRWDMRVLLFAGMFLAAWGVYLFSHLNLSSGPWNFVWPQLAMGAGLSFTFVPLSTITVDPIPSHEMGYATSLIALARNLGSSFGISAMTTLVARRTQLHQMRLVTDMSRRPSVFGAVRDMWRNLFFHHGGSLTAVGHQALAQMYEMVRREASAMGYLDGFRVLASLFIIVSPLVWLMHKPHFKRGAAG
jgi:MFS transporter, DHA2 family, multidrug resistance protein